MDYTETPGAEDFAVEIDILVKKYKLKKKVAAEILRDFADDLSPIKKPKAG